MVFVLNVNRGKKRGEIGMSITYSIALSELERLFR
jgi:hypothetical protein